LTREKREHWIERKENIDVEHSTLLDALMEKIWKAKRPCMGN